MECKLAPASDVGGKKNDPETMAISIKSERSNKIKEFDRCVNNNEVYTPIHDAKTTPKPIPNGAPMFMNLSLGAHIATVDSPPTTPAVILKYKKRYMLQYLRISSYNIDEVNGMKLTRQLLEVLVLPASSMEQ